MANLLKDYFEIIGDKLDVKIRAVITDGLQPIGRGIGPALEASDVLAVLKCEKNAPQNLRERSLDLAGQILEFSPHVKSGTGKQIATDLLDSGRAWKKFQAICKAQGGMFEIPTASYAYEVVAKTSGKVNPH